VCASCHRRLDPLGFSLENYSAVGQWRTVDGKFAIDPTGALPDGRPLSGPADLRTILLAERDAFTRGLTEKMLIYAVGRGMERFDRATIKQIAAEVAANDYRASSLILGVVESAPFQMRRGETKQP
jgi:hypothetical protein